MCWSVASALVLCLYINFLGGSFASTIQSSSQNAQAGVKTACILRSRLIIADETSSPVDALTTLTAYASDVGDAAASSVSIDTGDPMQETASPTVDTPTDFTWPAPISSSALMSQAIAASTISVIPVADNSPSLESQTPDTLPLTSATDIGNMPISPTDFSSPELGVTSYDPGLAASSALSTAPVSLYTSAPSTIATQSSTSASLETPTGASPTSMSPYAVPPGVKASPTMATSGMQRGIKCTPGLFLEAGRTLYNLTCDIQAAGNRIFASMHDNVMQCAMQCSELRGNGTECDAVIFNQKLLRKRAPVNCYGLTGVVGLDVKTLVDTAVWLDNNYTVVNGGVVLRPAPSQPSFSSTPPIAAPTNTFSDDQSAGAAKTTPNFYSPYIYPTSTVAIPSYTEEYIPWTPPGMLSPTESIASTALPIISSSSTLSQSVSSPRLSSFTPSSTLSSTNSLSLSTSVPTSTSSSTDSRIPASGSSALLTAFSTPSVSTASISQSSSASSILLSATGTRSSTSGSSTLTTFSSSSSTSVISPTSNSGSSSTSTTSIRSSNTSGSSSSSTTSVTSTAASTSPSSSSISLSISSTTSSSSRISSSSVQSSTPTPASSACPKEEYVTNGGFLDGSSNPWSLIPGAIASVSLQQNPANLLNYRVVFSVENGADGISDYSYLTQTIPGLCPDADYTFSYSSQFTANVGNNLDGECGVNFGLYDQDLPYIAAAGNGEKSDTFPSQYQKNTFSFQYGGVGDDPGSLTMSIYCNGNDISATYTIDDISLTGPSCCQSSQTP